MKKGLRKTICFVMFIFLLVGCSNNNAQLDGTTKQISNNVTVVELAKKAFNEIFSEFKALEITKATTNARTDDGNHTIVEITYTSTNGNGTYGFEYDKDADGNYILIKQGEDVSIYNLTE